MNREELSLCVIEPCFDSSSDDERDSAAAILERTSKFSRRPQRFTPQFAEIVDQGRNEFELFGCRVQLEWTICGRLWDSSVVLVKHLLASRASWSGCRVLELGAGVGLVGLVLARHGADVTMTELGAALPLLRRNVALNASAARVDELEWSDARPPDERFTTVPWDLVIAADCLLPYDAALMSALAATLRFVSTPQRTQCLVVFEERFDVSPFFELVSRGGAAVEHVAADAWQRDEHEREPLIRLAKVQFH